MIVKNLMNLQISNFNLPVIQIINISQKEIDNLIKEKIQQTHNFLKHTPVVINVEQLTHKSNWEKLYQLILDTKLHVIGVCSCNDTKLRKIIIQSGLPILTENKQTKNYGHFASTRKNQKKIETETIYKTQLINRPIRSGQQIYARNSDLIIINDVSPGAEIVSNGNVHIYGIMRGRIFAGASGNEKSQIFCMQFFPELISINGHYLIGDQIPKKFIGKSVRITLQNNILNIHSL